jgi:nucleoside-diphosphate-sugar epimerase
MRQEAKLAIAFVAGATGFTGREVVRQCAARGHRTVAHVRPDSPRLAEWRQRFDAWGAETDTTPWELGAMTERLVALRPDAVFALLGTTRARGRRVRRAGGDPESYETVDYGLTRLLLEASGYVQPPPRFVYLSAAGTSRSAASPYYAARAKLETLLREGRVPFVVARPSFITGADRDDERPMERIGARISDSALRVAAALGAKRSYERYRSTTNERLAAALVHLAFDPGASGFVESETLQALAG